MSELKEVPTDELLSFQDYPTTHTNNTRGDFFPTEQINIDVPQSAKSYDFDTQARSEESALKDDSDDKAIHSFWTIEYFQKFFDVDTKDVSNRIMGSVIPKKDLLLRNEIKARPDLYGPFWISVTLIFTIAISGNIANYLQHANSQYHWKYDFHLVSYAATTIFLYVTLVPLGLWGLFKWSKSNSELEEFGEPAPNILELVCIYGYSLFIYIPTSILWTIQINWVQWSLVLVASSISGFVLLMTLSSSINQSKQKLVLTLCILALHLLLAAGFMLFFFHVPKGDIVGVITHSNKTTAPI